MGDEGSLDPHFDFPKIMVFNNTKTTHSQAQSVSVNLRSLHRAVHELLAWRRNHRRYIAESRLISKLSILYNFQ
jgi:hypothetical protein